MLLHMYATSIFVIVQKLKKETWSLQMSIFNTIISLMGYSGLYFFLYLQKIELAPAFFVMLLVPWKNKQQQFSERIDEEI